MLHDILHGDFMTAHVPEGARQLQDIAFSGNGESTSSAQFGPAIARVENVLSEFGLLGQLPVRLITNGSQMDKPEVLAAIEHLARIHGEIWFKVDAATREGIARINDVHLQPQGVLQRLRSCAQRCPTWVQTCVFALDGVPPAENEIATYLELLLGAKDVIAGVHLYGLARPSMQREAPRLSRLPEAWLQQLAQRIAALGLEVRVSP
jgi:wyosine [tRNA(Phe)-imidazoG37] synthetase (radical SAM superfamily)